MDLRTLNTLKTGVRIRMTKGNKEVGTRAGEMGTVTAVARASGAPELPTVYVQLDSPQTGLLAWDNELMLTPECYLDLTDENHGIDSRIDPDSIVAGMELTDVPRSPADEQGLRRLLREDKAA
jgi:hypothetical protein